MSNDKPTIYSDAPVGYILITKGEFLHLKVFDGLRIHRVTAPVIHHSKDVAVGLYEQYKRQCATDEVSFETSVQIVPVGYDLHEAESI